jgi:hypothetical protein
VSLIYFLQLCSWEVDSGKIGETVFVFDGIQAVKMYWSFSSLDEYVNCFCKAAFSEDVPEWHCMSNGCNKEP